MPARLPAEQREQHGLVEGEAAVAGRQACQPCPSSRGSRLQASSRAACRAGGAHGGGGSRHYVCMSPHSHCAGHRLAAAPQFGCRAEGGTRCTLAAQHAVPPYVAAGLSHLDQGAQVASQSEADQLGQPEAAGQGRHPQVTAWSERAGRKGGFEEEEGRAAAGRRAGLMSENRPRATFAIAVLAGQGRPTTRPVLMWEKVMSGELGVSFLQQRRQQQQGGGGAGTRQQPRLPSRQCICPGCLKGRFQGRPEGHGATRACSAAGNARRLPKSSW